MYPFFPIILLIVHQKNTIMLHREDCGTSYVGMFSIVNQGSLNFLVK